MMALILRRPFLAYGNFFPILLLLSIYGFAMSLLLGRGTYKPSLYVCAYSILGIFIFRRDMIRLDSRLMCILSLGIILNLQGILMAGDKLWGGFHTALSGAMVILLAMQMLPGTIGNRRAPSHGSVAAIFLLIAVPVQAIAYQLNLNKAGLFSNIHYLALFSVLTLPLLLHFAITQKNRMRWIFALALFGDFWLLLKTQSRPGYLALLGGSIATIPFLSPSYRLSTLGIIIFLPIALYFSGLFGFAPLMDDLATNLLRDQRAAMWVESWAMQRHSSTQEWLLGHGFGRYFKDYQMFSSLRREGEFTFPHNYFLEVLYSHGITGLSLVILAYGWFFKKLAATAFSCQDAALRQTGILLIGIAITDFILGFLTLPLFSRHNLYPFSLILGVSLHYFRKASPHE